MMLRGWPSTLIAKGPIVSTLVSAPAISLSGTVAEPQEEMIGDHVLGLLAEQYVPPHVLERRAEQRYPYPRLIHLTPIDSQGHVLVDETIVVVGKDLSQRGMGFFHQQPLPYRRMIASLETSTGAWIAFLVDLTWCRFTQHGWYDSGGRFLEEMPSPLAWDTSDQKCRGPRAPY